MSFPPINTPAEHFSRLADLTEWEWTAEKEENKRELDRWPLEVRESLGKTVSRLHIEREDLGVGGLPLLVLARPSQGEDLAPFHAMDQGDIVRVTFDDEKFSVDGTLYEVDEYRVSVALDKDLLELPQGRCTVDLLGSDATYRRMQKALRMAPHAHGRLAELRDVLLGLLPPQHAPAHVPLFYNTSLNEFQRQAVVSALGAKDAALIHGPPGTGKTTVLAEIIRQAVKRGQTVLATAPSNVAVDNMLERLLAAGVRCVRLGHPARTLEELRHATLLAQIAELPQQKTLRDLEQARERLAVQRLRALDRGEGLSREENKSMKKEIRSLWKEARDLEKSLSREVLGRAQVVLATHGGIGQLLANETYDLVVMDEASQATESLSWVALLHARKVVLAGDPLQLPPTLYSQDAVREGLSVTLMDRLTTTLPDPCRTLLRVQYRMHKTIMSFSSDQFYEGRLIADRTVAAHRARDIPGVATTPLTEDVLVLIDTAGTGFVENWNELMDSRENEGEARLALKVWEELSAAGVKPWQTAIITPYAAQARKLRSQVPRGLEVGTVDGFQGREKEIILLSLVRSNDQGEVGFLSDTRRMNVALTRARRLLVVLGDSATLTRHRFYEQFLEYVDQHGTHQSAWEWLTP